MKKTKVIIMQGQKRKRRGINGRQEGKRDYSVEKEGKKPKEVSNYCAIIQWLQPLPKSHVVLMKLVQELAFKIVCVANFF